MTAWSVFAIREAPRHMAEVKENMPLLCQGLLYRIGTAVAAELIMSVQPIVTVKHAVCGAEGFCLARLLRKSSIYRPGRSNSPLLKHVLPC